MLATEATESTQASEPTEPMDRIEPAEPTDKIEPLEPMDRIEPLEPMLRIDPGEPMLRNDPDPREPAERDEVSLLPMPTFCRSGLRPGDGGVNAAGSPAAGRPGEIAWENTQGAGAGSHGPFGKRG
jgi:hypothetical protein